MNDWSRCFDRTAMLVVVIASHKPETTAVVCRIRTAFGKVDKSQAREEKQIMVPRIACHNSTLIAGAMTAASSLQEV